MRKREWGDRLRQVEKLAHSYQQSPLSSQYQPRLARPSQPSPVWHLFHRQSPALVFAQTCKEDVHVFALEREGGGCMGQRIYLVTSYTELWHYYRTYRRSLMHCYEVIPEGAVCKLYFDLEFQRAWNPGLNGETMVARLIQYVCKKLHEAYGLKCSSSDVLNLDSSTEDKFSRHLIFQLPNATFRDNSHVGRFIHAILTPVKNSNHPEGSSTTCTSEGIDPLTAMEYIPNTDRGMLGSPQPKRQKHGEDDLSFLSVKNKEGQIQLFVDLGVYTKNRNFRLYKSSKLGKNAALVVAEDNQFIPKPDRHLTMEENIFQASLISNVSYTGQRILTWDASELGNPKGPRPEGSSRAHASPDCVGGYQYSPYREVDDFVLTLVCKDNIKGSIRQWNYFVSEQLLVYDILHYRWCYNVGRFHKSNNIMILVDLREEVWYQKCYDPECRRQNYRSSNYPLPEDICISHLLKEEELTTALTDWCHVTHVIQDEDQLYLVDDEGNIELSQRPCPEASPEGGKPESSGQVGDSAGWGDWAEDDPCYLEALEEVERSSEEVSDELLLMAADDWENSS
ncbi:DNA-directed primase/polymerase protein isoform X1 [Alosa alosa]|uniref:DNA-directed primase/polymerase protein isoform X1 n=1 Tax=Alosa alosa TaxID=278164 RepID=UPI0020154FFB|nr:DNA-directed primase/polymerase protein isoform X1 [Alosa alosa]